MITPLLLVLSAAVPRLAILTAEVGPIDRRPAHRELFEALRSAAELRLGLSVASFDEIHTEGPESLAKNAADCGSNTACLMQLLRRHGYRYGLRVVLNASTDPALLSMQLVSAEPERVIGESLQDVPHHQATTTAKAAASELIDRTGLLRAARISIRVTPADAELFAGGAPSGAIAIVAPGPITVGAAREGFEPREVSIHTQAGEERTIELELAPISEASLFESPWFWAGVAAIVAGTAATIALTSGEEVGPLCITGQNASAAACKDP